MADFLFFNRNNYKNIRLNKIGKFNIGKSFDNEDSRVKEEIEGLRNTISKLNIFRKQDRPLLKLHTRQESEFSFQNNTEDYVFKSRTFLKPKNEFKKVSEIKFCLNNNKESDNEINDIVDTILNFKKSKLQYSKEKQSDKKLHREIEVVSIPSTNFNTNSNNLKKSEEENFNFSISDFSLDEEKADDVLKNNDNETQQKEDALFQYLSHNNIVNEINTSTTDKEIANIQDNNYDINENTYFDINNLNLSIYLNQEDLNEVTSLNLKDESIIKHNDSMLMRQNSEDISSNTFLSNNSFRKRVQFTDGNTVKYYTNKSTITNYIIRSSKIPKKKESSSRNLKSILKTSNNSIQTSINDVTLDMEKQYTLNKLNELIKECETVQNKENVRPNKLKPETVKFIKTKEPARHSLCKRYEKDPAKFYTNPINVPTTAKTLVKKQL
jgi:hypothetical protein